MLMVHPMDFRALAMQGALDATFKEVAKRKSMPVLQLITLRARLYEDAVVCVFKNATDQEVLELIKWRIGRQPKLRKPEKEKFVNEVVAATKTLRDAYQKPHFAVEKPSGKPISAGRVRQTGGKHEVRV